MARLLDVLNDRVLLCDGAIGSLVQAMDLDVARDFQGHENCTDILTRSRPDMVRRIHCDYLAAGADVITTNTFGASPITLGEFGLADEAEALNRRAAELALEAVAEFAGDGRSRFVAGDVGPGTKLPSLGHVDYDTLEDALAVQCTGLIAGGVDAIIIETCQDPLQMKAAINGAKRAAAAATAGDLPILVQVTVETTGTMLVGTDFAAVATVAHALGVPLLGLNCATGPEEMAEHVKWLGDNWPGPISVQPNAGLPQMVDGRPSYPLTPDELAEWLERFIEENGVGLVGGCCGTGTGHIEAVDAMLRRRGGDAGRPAPQRRQVHWVPAVASLYGQVPLRQESAFFSIGERCNANGSKKFRLLQEAGDWDGCVAMGREQAREGSNALDVCTAFVGRDEGADMSRVIGALRGAVTAPLVIDSTEVPVLKTALKLYGGKAVINSIHFEGGEEEAAERLALARRFGAAVIALTIDEDGMAKDVEGKLRIAKRLHDFACGEHGLPAADLLIDPLTFTVCTGNEDDRRLALDTLDAIGRIHEELPECQIILGVSNVSFGLKPAARHVLNSVFLDHALKRGMTGAIVHVSKIMPLHRIPPEELKAAEDLVFDRRADGYDPLHAFMGLFAEQRAVTEAGDERPADVAERLKKRIIDGDRQGLDADLDEALESRSPVDIINETLLGGMKVVGELFAAGTLQLPFVLQSAETMKAAVAYLEPFMEKEDSQDKGTVVLATVKGDVHDIGKNLVDIILTNNGYRVVNLGIKQPLANILAAIEEYRPDAVGMSGLLVKSAAIMRENLEEMARRGLDLPVLLGGAALTRRYVEEDCARAYATGGVAYARDAFDGLSVMGKIVAGDFHGAEPKPARTREEAPPATRPRPVDWREVRTRRKELHAETQIPQPPFWGARLLEETAPATLLPYLNRSMLFQFHWGYRKGGRTFDQWKDWAAGELEPILDDLLERCDSETILVPSAAYGYWKCASEGDSVVLFEDDGETECARFSFPRQRRPGGLCIADFFRPVEDGTPDLIALQAVTMGARASEVARQWFAADRYRDYLYLHGLGVELTEALAEFVHRRIRDELGFAGDDAPDTEQLFKQGYRGSRYSFGYPACPEMADQRTLLDLLGAERIGLAMAEEDQLHPEQSTTAIVVHHPQAKYFSV